MLYLWTNIIIIINNVLFPVLFPFPFCYVSVWWAKLKMKNLYVLIIFMLCNSSLSLSPSCIRVPFYTGFLCIRIWVISRVQQAIQKIVFLQVAFKVAIFKQTVTCNFISGQSSYQLNVPLFYPLKTSEIVWLPEVFRGFREEPSFV